MFNKFLFYFQTIFNSFFLFLSFRSYDDVDKVKTKVNQLQTDVDNLLEADIPIVGSHAEIIRLREFIQRKMKYDQTVVLIFNEREEKFTVFAKTEDSLRKVMDEWTSICRNHTRAQQSSPSFSYVSVKFRGNITVCYYFMA